MNSKLDPRILAQLGAFAARRRKLIIIRGIATALGLLLATMLAVAAADYFFVLSDTVRWTLSGIAYALVVIAEWRTCLRLLATTPGPKLLARLIEHAEPKLREDLLSAVELGEQRDASVFDSDQFRALVQQDVAARMGGMEMERVLPVRLVRSYIAIAGGIAIAVVALFVLSGFQFGTLMLRAFMPGANLARVSKTKVEIVSPNPAEALVPFGDAVPLQVKISGAPAREAWMETFTEHDGRQKVKLVASGADQFSGAIQVGREDLYYRVRAGDAITRKFRLNAEPRPYVVKFTKTLHPPAYLHAADQTVTEEAGDLIALEGTSVDLALETNQPMKSAELHMELAKSSTAVPLTLAKDGRLTASLKLTESGTYRVHLVAADTGFENKFSPEYEIRAEPDLVPKVEFTQPKGDLILPANDIVDLAGEAADDQGLARIEQHVRINEGEWSVVKLAADNGKEAKVTRRWDLFEQGVKAGDLVTTKLVAIDLKGNRGESRTMQISVTTAGVEMKRLESLDSLVALHGQLKLWRQSVESLAKASSEARQRFEQTQPSDPQRAAVLTAFTAADAEFERQHAATVAALATALRGSQAGHQSADLVTLGRQLARAESGSIRHTKLAAAIVALDPAVPFARDVMRDADDSANRSVQRARAIEEGFRVLLNSEEADLLAENTQIIRQEQQRLVDLAKSSGNDSHRWEMLGTRIRVVLAETKTLEDILGRLSERGLGGERGKNLAKELNKQRMAADKSMTDFGMSRELLAPTINLADGVVKAEKGALDLRAELERRPVSVVREFRQEAQATWQGFNRLISELERLAGNKALSPERRTDLQNGRWDSLRDSLKTHGDLEEIRPTSDAQFVADVRSTTSAMEGLRVLASTDGLPPTRERIITIDRAFRLLETAHDLQEMLDGLNALAVSERWQIATPRSRTAAPRDWGWLEMRLRETPGEMGRLDAREPAVREAVTAAHRIVAAMPGLPAFRDVDREMNERKKPDHPAASSVAEVDALFAEVKRALELLKPHVDAARQTIQQAAPRLHELAQALTKKAEELKQETKKQQAEAKDKAPEQAKAEAEKTLAEQQSLNEKVDALKDQLRADANKQNMNDATQRERARDADDALAMLKDPPPKSAEALKDAAEAATPPAERAEALAQAAQQQEKLQQALNQIAQHYEAMEQGKNPQETRTAMRAQEAELGVKKELDEQYAKAERMAQLANSSPEEMLKQLEKALPINPLMQQELSSISQNTIVEAHRKLEAASKAEARVAETVNKLAQQEAAAAQAEAAARPPQDPANQASPTQPQPAAQAQAQSQPNTANPPQPNAAKPQNPMAADPNAAKSPTAPQNPQLAQAAEQQSPIGETAAEAGSDVMRAGRHEERLKNTEPGRKLQEMGQQITRTAEEKVPAAQQALTQSPKAAQAQEHVSAANQELAAEASQLSRMARGQGDDLPPVPDLPPPPSKQMNAQQMQQAQQMKPGTAASDPSYEKSAQADASKQAQAQQPSASAPAQAQPQTSTSPKSAQTPGSPQDAAAQQAAAGQPKTPSSPTSHAPMPGQPDSPMAPTPPGLPSALDVPASPQEQTWMARTLDALDSAMNAKPGSQQGGEKQEQQAAQQGAQQNQNGQQQAQQNQQGQQQQGQQQQGQQGQQGQSAQQQAMQQAQNSMQQAQQAAQQAMRQARSQNVAPTPQSMASSTNQQEKSEQGAQAQMAAQDHGALPDARGLKAGDWGKLPKQMAEQLSRGQGEAVSAEYRGQVETYYRVIAERAKKK